MMANALNVSQTRPIRPFVDLHHRQVRRGKMDTITKLLSMQCNRSQRKKDEIYLENGSQF